MITTVGGFVEVCRNASASNGIGWQCAIGEVGAKLRDGVGRRCCTTDRGSGDYVLLRQCEVGLGYVVSINMDGQVLRGLRRNRRIKVANRRLRGRMAQWNSE